MSTQRAITGLLISCLCTFSHQASAARRVLIIGIDSLRGDELHHVISDDLAPAMRSIGTNGSYSRCPQPSAPTCATAHQGYDFKSDYIWKTGPGWGSVISGLDAARHGIKNIDHKSMSTFTATTKQNPTIFALAKAKGLKTAAAGVGAFLASLDGKKIYPGITDYECGSDANSPSVKTSDTSSCNLDFRKTFNNQDEKRDDGITNAAIGWINDASISLVMIVLDQVDAAGHKFGFAASKEYRNSIEKADERVKRMLDTIKSRTQKGDEWLVVVTSDHGGHNQTKLLSWLPKVNRGIHGTESGQDNIVPFLLSTYPPQKSAIPSLQNETDVRQFDTFKTAATWLRFGNEFGVAGRDGTSRVK